MVKVTRNGLLFIGSMAGLIGVRLWKRRHLARVARRINYDGHLMLAAVRISQEIRDLADVERILEVSVEETGRSLDVEHSILQIEDENGGPALMRYYCKGGSCQDEHSLIKDLEVCAAALAGGAADRYVNNGYARGDNTSPAENEYPLLGVPVASADGLMGTLMLRSADPSRIWLENEAQALMAVAHQVSLAVKGARLLMLKEQQALRDPLTDCLNLRAFEIELKRGLSLAASHDRPLSLVMIDIDNFKKVNDTYGHPTGDRVLCMLADILRGEIEAGAVAARLGGEEFVLVLPDCEVEKAVSLAERIRTRVERMRVPGVSGIITASFGIATFPLHASSYDSLIERADGALYQAKRTGRNRVCAP
jgi:diguanylate cyclase (GGDEF)-like protein